MDVDKKEKEVYSTIEKIVITRFPSFIRPLLKKVFKNNNYLKRKKLNFILNQFEMKLNRRYLISYPYYLVIDPTNICNLKCPLCPTWQDVKARPKGKMNIETFCRLLNETGPYLFVLNLCNWGEPLLNPDLSAMITYAKQFNTVVGLSTNLNYLPDETAQKLILSGVDIIVISIDGVSQKSYSKYRVGGNLETVLGNVEKLLSYRQGSHSPLLIWQFLVNRYNESEIEKAKDMAHEMGILFVASPIRTSMGTELLLPLYKRVKEIENWLPENPAFNKYAYDIKPDTKTTQTFCKWLWNSTVVNWDGSVSPCCGVFEKIWDFDTCCYPPGEKVSSFHQVWNSPRYRLARKLVSAYMQKSKNLASLLQHSEEKGLICSKCIHYGFLED